MMPSKKNREKIGTVRNVAIVDGERIANCHQCGFKQILPDPDPVDWFNDDDVKVVCTKTKRKDTVITSACRPYKVKEECSGIPWWCPVLDRIPVK